jgi:uncharacterized membrane protein YbhN (UPF0104 family)
MFEDTKSEIRNFFYEMFGIAAVGIAILALAGIIYGIYGEATARQTAWLLALILLCVVGFDCSVEHLKQFIKKSTDRIYGIGSTREVLRELTGAILIPFGAVPLIIKSLQELYALENNNVFGILALIALSVTLGIIVSTINKRKG